MCNNMQTFNKIKFEIKNVCKPTHFQPIRRDVFCIYMRICFRGYIKCNKLEKKNLPFGQI